jgi:hypothetical protein
MTMPEEKTSLQVLEGDIIVHPSEVTEENNKIQLEQLLGGLQLEPIKPAFSQEGYPYRNLLSHRANEIAVLLLASQFIDPE